MGKDSEKKEDSGFGFKDRAKAEETIELLKSHDLSYQRLTVRGLLGRAKRVLTLTKAEDKIKNIKGAMEIFEKWLQDYEKEHPPKSSSKSSSKPQKNSSLTPDDDDEEEEPAKEKKEAKEKSKDDAPTDSVPGLGFKDKEKAEETIKLLEGRDPDYQKLAVKGLVGRAKRVLTCTRDKDKVQNIKDAMAVFEDFLDDFDKTNQSKKNMSYLPLSVVETCLALVKKHGLPAGRHDDFLDAYKKNKGEYKKLRTVEDKSSGNTWDITRNRELNEIKNTVGDAKLFEDNGNPTKDHLKMIVWAYSPEDHKLKKLKIKDDDNDVEMKDVEKSSNGEKKKDEKKEHKSTSKDSKSSSKDKDSSKDSRSSSKDSKSSSERKRKHSETDSSSDSNSDDESPSKRKK